MRSRIILFVLGCVLCAAVHAGWQAPRFGVGVDAFPAGWETRNSDENGFQLRKEFIAGGYWFHEWITLGVARDTTAQIDGVVRDLRNRGYSLVDRDRLRIGPTDVPFWFLFRQPSAEEVAWLAVVLRGGVVFTLELRATPHDLDALADFGRVLQAFRFTADPRERGWNAFLSGDLSGAERGFESLLRENADDANARYGLGLTLLARRSTRSAVRELERARTLLGLTEDVRRALARARFDSGDPGRAAITWIQVIRDNPGWDTELRPWVLRAAEMLSEPSDERPAGSPVRQYWGDIGAALTFFDGLSERLLGPQPVQVGPDQVEAARLAVREDIERLIPLLLNGAVRRSDALSLLGALDLERSIDLIAGGLTRNDRDSVLRGRVLLGAAMRAIGGSDAK